MILQLNPTLPLTTPKGKALAHFLIDNGDEHHLLWVCIQDETGEIWAWPNTDVRARDNPTMGRNIEKKSDELLKEMVELCDCWGASGVRSKIKEQLDKGTTNE